MANVLSVSLASLALFSNKVEAAQKKKADNVVIIEVESWTGEPFVDRSLTHNGGDQYQNGIVGVCLLATGKKGENFYLFINFPGTKIKGRVLTIVNPDDHSKTVLKFKDSTTAQEYYENMTRVLPNPQQAAKKQIDLDQYWQQWGRREE